MLFGVLMIVEVDGWCWYVGGYYVCVCGNG